MNEKSDEYLTWKSVEAWHHKYERPLTADYSPYSCPLCQEYLIEIGTCINCPIYLDTGKIRCEGTPYDAVDKMLDKKKLLENEDIFETIKLLRPLILDEISYLVDLAIKLGDSE